MNSSLRKAFMEKALDKQQAVASREVMIPFSSIALAGELNLPASATGLVLFAHGNGSSRHSPRNQYLAQVIREAGVGTLRLDLLTQEEEGIDLQTRHLRFDIPMLARRMVAATAWVKSLPETGNLRIGYFGASTGGGAALIAAARLSNETGAVVSGGGRPDLAGAALPQVTAPTLLLVGGLDKAMIQLNEEALAQLQCVKELKIVPGATHLFEESGKFEEVARQTADWFQHYLR